MFTAESVSDPEPVFVIPAVDVATGSATTIAPVLESKVSVYVPVNALPDATSKVSVFASA